MPYKFKLKFYTPGLLKKLGFEYSLKSDTENTYYYKSFPVIKYNKIPILFAVILINIDNNNVQIDVYDKNNDCYSPWYLRKNGFGAPIYRDLIQKIDNRIMKEIKKIGIIKWEK